MTCHALPFFFILSHFIISWHVCPNLLTFKFETEMFFQPGFSESHLAVPKSAACGLASNYVDCIAALSDRTTKGLQGFHYTLSFLCKPGNKPAVSCSFRKPHRFLRKSASLFAGAPCVHGDHCQNQICVQSVGQLACTHNHNCEATL